MHSVFPLDTCRVSRPKGLRAADEVIPKLGIPEGQSALRIGDVATYDRPIVINLSSPGAEPDPTTQLFEASSIKLYYFAACPHCGRYQRFVWDRYEWEPKRDVEGIHNGTI